MSEREREKRIEKNRYGAGNTPRNKILVNAENGETYEIDERCKSKLLPFQKIFDDFSE